MDEQTYKIIEKVINKIAHKYTFRDYDLEDIKQEAFIICHEALSRYDNDRPLENFMSVHLSNRLKNFVRDNYYVKENQHKKKIKSPQYILDDNIANDSYNLEDYIIQKEILEKIDEKIPVSLREDYLKLCNGVSIQKNKKDKLLDFIRSFIDNEER